MNNNIPITVGELLFQFSSFAQWVGKASSWFRNSGVTSERTICVDIKGRVCRTGKEFMRARDDGSFPIRVYAILCEDEEKKP